MRNEFTAIIEQDGAWYTGAPLAHGARLSRPGGDSALREEPLRHHVEAQQRKRGNKE